MEWLVAVCTWKDRHTPTLIWESVGKKCWAIFPVYTVIYVLQVTPRNLWIVLSLSHAHLMLSTQVAGDEKVAINDAIRSSNDQGKGTVAPCLALCQCKAQNSWNLVSKIQRFTCLIIVASGQERPGATSNRVFIESYWCLIWGRPDIKVGGATLNRDAASNDSN